MPVDPAWAENFDEDSKLIERDFFQTENRIEWHSHSMKREEFDFHPLRRVETEWRLNGLNGAKRLQCLQRHSYNCKLLRG